MKRSYLFGVVLLASVVLLQGCNHDDDPEMRTFQVSVTNVTANQPMSPLAVVLHGVDYQGLMVGSQATLGLEKLAEGGDNSLFLSDATSDSTVSASMSGSGLILPGESDSVTLTAGLAGLRLTLAAMLGNTNDGFAALDGVDLGELTVNGTMNLSAIAHDAGTEGNSEAMADVPGPAGGGEGYNAARDDRDFVVIHPGVISQDDGLTTSVLNESHRFANPVARVVVTRVQ